MQGTDTTQLWHGTDHPHEGEVGQPLNVARLALDRHEPQIAGDEIDFTVDLHAFPLRELHESLLD